MCRGKDAAIIELEVVCLRFGDLKILENFNLKLFEGDSLVLVGPSGSGKSSLLKLMAGLISPQKGRILFRNRDISTLSRKDRDQLLAEVGMLFQQNALPFALIRQSLSSNKPPVRATNARAGEKRASKCLCSLNSEQPQKERSFILDFFFLGHHQHSSLSLITSSAAASK